MFQQFGKIRLVHLNVGSDCPYSTFANCDPFAFVSYKFASICVDVAYVNGWLAISLLGQFGIIVGVYHFVIIKNQ